jgi:magnesium transporter
MQSPSGTASGSPGQRSSPTLNPVWSGLPSPLASAPAPARTTTSVSTTNVEASPTSNMPASASPTTASQSKSVIGQSLEGGTASSAKKKKKNRNRKRRNRRPSFLASEEPGPIVTELPSELARAASDQLQEGVPFYRGRNLSNSSLESEALLDHRYDC